MKRRSIKTGVIALILACIYFIGLFVGIFMISYLPSAGKRQGFVYLTNWFAAQYAETGEIDPAEASGIAAIVYDADGQTVDFFRHSNWQIDYDLIAEGKKELPQVLAGDNALRLIMFVKEGSTLGYTSLMYVGVPIYTDGEITGAVFWVRELKDLLEIILAYLVIFSAVFILAAVLMLLYLRNQQRYDQMRQSYTDNITHELKSPIASIKALVEALSDEMEKNANDRHVYYGMILKEANRQEHMIHDVLELSKLQSAYMNVPKKRVTAASIFDPVCEKYALFFDLKGIHFSRADDLAHMPDLQTNTACIQQVTEAILSNALKFVSEGGKISITANLSPRRVTVCIADNGKGISKDALPHIFERFYKVSENDNESGSGLGLAIAKEMMDRLGEKIWVCSEETVGTCFYFTIKIHGILTGLRRQEKKSQK